MNGVFNIQERFRILNLLKILTLSTLFLRMAFSPCSARRIKNSCGKESWSQTEQRISSKVQRYSTFSTSLATCLYIHKRELLSSTLLVILTLRLTSRMLLRAMEPLHQQWACMILMDTPFHVWLTTTKLSSSKTRRRLHLISLTLLSRLMNKLTSRFF